MCMAIAGQFQDLTDTEGSLRAQRRVLRLETEGALASGDATKVMIHNVSATGLLLECDISLDIDETIEVELPEAGATVARIVWSSGRLHGCEFAAPVSQATLSAAQLRSAVAEGIGLEAAAAPQTNESFGARLQRLRRQQGLSMDRLASILGVSKPTVWAWEQGKARPLAGRIEKLAEALGVSAGDLNTGEDISGVSELVARTREQLAATLNINPAKIRIMIEL